jgi:hypothetical protein
MLMLGKRFIWIYSLVWVFTGILLVAADTVDWLKDSLVLRYLAIPAIVIAMAFYVVKQIPGVNDVKVSRPKITIFIIGSSVVFTLIRGMVPDGILPDSILVELFIKYLYSLALLHIILKMNFAEGSGAADKEL